MLREGEMWGKSGQISWKRKHLLKFGQVKMGRSVLRGRNFIMTKIPEVRTLGSTQKKKGRNTEGEQCGFRKKPISPFLFCYF